MLGDAASSWVKRRLGLARSARAIGLDQIPESLLPLLALAQVLDLGWGDIFIIVAAFTAFDLVVSRLLYRLGWRNRPH
ncbi:CDP-archaeol synthase, partial [Thiococcus pfennigii]